MNKLIAIFFSFLFVGTVFADSSTLATLNYDTNTTSVYPNDLKTFFQGMSRANTDEYTFADDITSLGVITGDDVVGELYFDGSFEKVADSITFTDTVDGDLITGTVTDTQTINQTYYQVQELGGTAPGFTMAFNFTLANSPGKFTFVGRYIGTTAHDCFVYAWNYDTSSFDRFTSAEDDIPTDTSDATFTFDYADLPGAITDYISGTDSIVKIDHPDNGNATHDIYVDYVGITERQFTVATGGTFATVTGYTLGENNNVTMNATNGTMTIVEAGRYLINMSVSFLGSDDETFRSHIFVDDVQVDKIGLTRKLGSGGDIGSTGFVGIVDLAVDEVLKIKFTGDMTGSWASVQNMNWNITRIN